MQDKIINCIQCNEPFLFSAEESKRFLSLGFDEPSRCPYCRRKKSKNTNSEASWKDKGRKKHPKRKIRGAYDDDI